ncbi:hypothetical protein K439DRAFT_1613714 [Ramaria rubella]|nr:hypothetical protein K439DRAFT_1613714 [Ramaria rubella]
MSHPSPSSLHTHLDATSAYPPAEQPPKLIATCKTREKFTFTDIEKLNGVLHVDPFMCKRTQSKDKWQEIVTRVPVGQRPPLKFAVLSGCLDAVAAMKKHAKQVLEEEHDQVKEAQDLKTTHGNIIHDAMVQGHAHKAKHTQDAPLDSDSSDKENILPALPSQSNSVYEIKSCVSAKRHHEEGFKQLASLIKSLMEKNKIHFKAIRMNLMRH